ncbi:plasmid mobilization protein [Ferruginibacter sp.]
MKKEEQEVRIHFVRTRMNIAELNNLKNLQRKAHEKTVSSYARKVILQPPVKVKYRNQSADDFYREMVGLKNELSAIGNNLNQSVHKLHLLDRVPEFKDVVKKYDGLQKIFFSDFEEIKFKINQLYYEYFEKLASLQLNE